MTRPMPTIHHEDLGGSGRYSATLPGIGDEAELTWRAAGPGVIIAEHAYAPDSLRGTGIAMALVSRLIEDARQRGLRIIPTCSYVRLQFDRHPDWADLRA